MPGRLSRDQGGKLTSPPNSSPLLRARPGVDLLTLAGVLAVLFLAFVWLVPPGSVPVGFDAWWSLFLGKTLASQGFPSSIPAAGWTPYAEHFADKHLLLSGLLALAYGKDLGPEHAAPLIWGLVLLQALGLFWALRILRPTASPLWLLLLPALSSTWVFRSTALRDLPLALAFLAPLLASLVQDAQDAKGDIHSPPPGSAGNAKGDSHVLPSSSAVDAKEDSKAKRDTPSLPSAQDTKEDTHSLPSAPEAKGDVEAKGNSAKGDAKGDTHAWIPGSGAGHPRAPEGGRAPRWRTFLLSLAYCYSHGAWLLPLLCAVLVGLGARLQRGKFAFRPLGLLLLAWIPALLLRPDFPANLKLLGLMNFGMPWAILQGELRVVPTEFLPYSLGDLLRWNAPLLLAGLALPLLAKARRLPLSLLLPILFVLLGLACAWRPRLSALRPGLPALQPRLPAWTLALLLPLGWLQVRAARPSVEANRFPALQEVATWLRANGRPGEVVWVSDWGLSSPLIYGTVGTGLVFTGVMDPTLMWGEAPGAWRAWQEVKLGLSEDPLETLRRAFHPRFLILPVREAPPGQAAGSTAARLYEGLKRLQSKGVPVQTTARPIGGRWLCYRIGW